MSKVSFRARALDATKPLPIYRSDEVPDLYDYNVINRAVPQMPTGMEKEEESVSRLCCARPLARAIQMITVLFFCAAQSHGVSRDWAARCYICGSQFYSRTVYSGVCPM